MKSAIFSIIAAVFAVGVVGAPLTVQAQHPDLHLNSRWDNCSFVIDPALTQAQWRQFVGEAGLVTYFRPLASAKPLGPKRFEFALLNWFTKIDDREPAWNNTFSHPDADHRLADGDLGFPGAMLRVGITERVDIGAYVTKSPGANYGFLAGQIQYSFLNDVEKNLAGAVRLSSTMLYGPEDLKLNVYGLEAVVSRELSRFSPYIGVSTYLSRGRETTSAVDLDNESVLGLQGMVGVTASFGALRIGAEFNVARVPGYSIKIGFGS